MREKLRMLDAKSRRRVIFLLVVGIGSLLFCVGFPVYSAVANHLAKRTLAPFEGHLSEYLSFSESQHGEVYVRGKIIPVSKHGDQAQINSSLYFRLPKELRAATPDEVGTVVWTDCLWSSVGTYTRGGRAYRCDCDVTVIDKTAAKILGTKHFRGGDPPMTKTGPGDTRGSDPTNAIAKYLAGLPRK